MSELDAARDLVELGLAPPPPKGTSALKRALRRLALRAGRAQTIHQQRINRELLVLVERLREQGDELRSWLDELRSWLDELQRRTAAGEQGVHDLQQWNHELAERTASLERRLTPLDKYLAASRTLPGMTDMKLERLDAGSVGVGLGYLNTEESTDPDSAYLVFENTFRGSADLIRHRQEVYVPLLQGRDPVLDVGCGRGEMLELLVEAGIPARGIDLDPAMVDHCRAKGLDTVEQADGVSYLTGLDDASLGAIIALQVIEHLPYQQLLRFVGEAHRTLRPGGRFIVETINPHAPQALKTFWVDLSHQHPVFPEVTVSLCRTAGFAKAFVFHPGGSGDAERDRFEVGDYTVVAERASGESTARHNRPESSLQDRAPLAEMGK